MKYKRCRECGYYIPLLEGKTPDKHGIAQDDGTTKWCPGVWE